MISINSPLIPSLSTSVTAPLGTQATRQGLSSTETISSTASFVAEGNTELVTKETKNLEDESTSCTETNPTFNENGKSPSSPGDVNNHQIEITEAATEVSEELRNEALPAEPLDITNHGETVQGGNKTGGLLSTDVNVQNDSQTSTNCQPSSSKTSPTCMNPVILIMSADGISQDATAQALIPDIHTAGVEIELVARDNAVQLKSSGSPTAAVDVEAMSNSTKLNLLIENGKSNFDQSEQVNSMSVRSASSSGKARSSAGESIPGSRGQVLDVSRYISPSASGASPNTKLALTSRSASSVRSHPQEGSVALPSLGLSPEVVIPSSASSSGVASGGVDLMSASERSYTDVSSQTDLLKTRESTDLVLEEESLLDRSQAVNLDGISVDFNTRTEVYLHLVLALGVAHLFD